MKGIAIAFALTLLLIAVPVQGQTVTAAQKAETEKILTEATKEIVATVSNLSTDGWVKYASADFRERVGAGAISPAASGKEAYLKWAANIHSQRTTQILTTDLIKVDAISPDLAYVIWLGGVTTVAKSGRHGGAAVAWSMVWKKESDGWKVIHIHESWQ